MSIFTRFANALIARVSGSRRPDFVIGSSANPYLLRWWLFPRNRWFNVYLHRFCRPDDDRALHDHPWCWVSLILRGSYVEHTIARGGIHCRKLREAGSIAARMPSTAHRVELLEQVKFRESDPGFLPCWTLFITGPRVRNWGFHCSERGWIPWEKFTNPESIGETGPGCDA